MPLVTSTLTYAPRPRGFVRVAGPQAEDYLQRLVSNDVVALAPGDSCEALLLTPKARVIAPLRVLRRGADDFLLLTEPELADTVRAHLVRMRLAARAEIDTEEHDSVVVLGDASLVGVPNADYGVPAVELLDQEPPPDARQLAGDELEALRIRAGTPRFGREIDDRVLPAEAGLVERGVSFTKGCYPGQEPVARLHHRGHANRALRALLVETDELPDYDADVVHAGKVVGRVTSAVHSDDAVLALAYVRVEVADDAELDVGGARATRLH